MLVVYINNDKLGILLHEILTWCHYMHCSSPQCW